MMDSMSESAFRLVVDEAFARMQARNQQAVDELGLGSYERYDYDLPTSRFWFSSEGVPRVEASVVAVGSTSTITGTWLWAWANPHLSDVPSPEMEKVRAYGLARGFERLTNEKWVADEVDGWEMTAVAGMVLGAEVGYRCPDERGALFVLLSDLRRTCA